jgi:uncharacterized membrane protein YfcA
MPVTASEAALVVCVATFAAAVQGPAGFGAALIAAPILVLLDPVFVPGPMLIASLLLAVLLCVRERRSVDLRGVGWALTGRVPGTLLGLMCLDSLAADQLPHVFAALILLAVALSTLGVRVSPRPTTLALAGVLSGVMGTVTSAGGPPVALLYQHERAPTLRGTLSGFFMVSTSISIAGLALYGLLGVRELIAAAVIAPGVLLGFLISGHTRHYLDRGGTRSAVLALTTTAALVLILKHL